MARQLLLSLVLHGSWAVKVTPASSFDGFHNAEGTFTTNADPAVVRDKSYERTLLNPHQSGKSPAFFQEPTSGGSTRAWQTQDVSRFDNTPPGKFGFNAGGAFTQDYASRPAAHGAPKVLTADFFDSRVRQFDQYGRSFHPHPASDEAYRTLYSRRKKTVKFGCDAPGCEAAANLGRVPLSMKATNCKLRVSIVPTDFDGDKSIEEVEYIKVNGIAVNKHCRPRSNGCGNPDVEMYNCISDHPFRLYKDDIKVEIKINDAVDQCANSDNNLLAGEVEVVCDWIMKPGDVFEQGGSLGMLRRPDVAGPAGSVLPGDWALVDGANADHAGGAAGAPGTIPGGGSGVPSNLPPDATFPAGVTYVNDVDNLETAPAETTPPGWLAKLLDTQPRALPAGPVDMLFELLGAEGRFENKGPFANAFQNLRAGDEQIPGSGYGGLFGPGGPFAPGGVYDAASRGRNSENDGTAFWPIAGGTRRVLAVPLQCSSPGCSAHAKVQIKQNSSWIVTGCEAALEMVSTDMSKVSERDEDFDISLWGDPSGEPMVKFDEEVLPDEKKEPCKAWKEGKPLQDQDVMIRQKQKLQIQKVINTDDWTLNIQGRLGPVVDECPFNGNLLAAVVVLTCDFTKPVQEPVAAEGLK